MNAPERAWTCLDPDQAAAIIAVGGCIIYPTETLYGLGAAIKNREALVRIARIKGRPAAKPLPLVLGDFEQIREVVEEGFFKGPLFADFSRLAARFWPGPLSLVLPGRKDLSPLLTDSLGRVSARQTPHPLAATLCRLARTPLAATSANKSGQSAPRVPAEIDPELAALTDGVLVERPWPSGGAPSTVVVVLGCGGLNLVREGAVSLAALQSAGFSVSLDEG